MKKIFTAALCAVIIAASALPALASPSADIAMSVADASVIDGETIITVDIALSEPSEAFASLDFNLVSSDYDNLSIIEIDDGDEETVKLDIEFTQGYGSAYHAGRADELTGGYRYLIGIYSQAAGNKITNATDICSARLRYSGDAPQTLQIRDLKLVYIDSGGSVVAAAQNTQSPALTIDSSYFIDADIDDGETPLSGAPFTEIPAAEVPQRNMNIVLWIVIGAVIVAAAVLIVLRKKFVKRKAG